jgi:hypothetical protein
MLQLTGDVIGGTTAGQGNQAASGGGGIYNSVAPATFKSCAIAYNQASGSYGGGGIYVYGSSVSIMNSSIEHNSAHFGGGIKTTLGHVRVSGGTVAYNKAQDGGGILNQFFGTLKVSNERIEFNSASATGGGIDDARGTATLTGVTITHNSAGIDGGGIYVNRGSMTITSSKVASNSAELGGGIAQVYGVLGVVGGTIGGSQASQGNSAHTGGGLYDFAGRATVKSCGIASNQASSFNGGGIYVSGGSLTVSKSSIEHNSAQSGGGLANTSGRVSVSGGTIAYNKAAVKGGGIANDRGTLKVDAGAIENNSAFVGGGGIYDSRSTATIMGSTLLDNTAPTGGGIYINRGMLTVNGSSITGSSSTGVLVQNGAVATISNSNLTDNATGVEVGATGGGRASVTDDLFSHDTTGIDVNGGSATIGIAGHGNSFSSETTGVSVEEDPSSNSGSATIQYNTFRSPGGTAVAVGSGVSDTSTATIHFNDLSLNAVGIVNLETATIDGTYNWWGSSDGPGGSNPSAAGSVNVSPWLGDSASLTLPAPDSLGFSTTAANQYVVTPNGANTSLGVTLGGNPDGSISGGGSLEFVGNGGTITINGESGAASTDVFTITDPAVLFNAADGLTGTTVHFNGSSITRNVDAQGTSSNTFHIQGAGANGPSGSLVGGSSGPNAFVFSATGNLIGNIQGAGSSTLDYSAYSRGVTVNLVSGAATGVVSGTVAGVTAVIGSNFNDTITGNGTGVLLTGGLGTNTITGNGTDTVVESGSTSYTLTSGSLTGTSPKLTDTLSGIKDVTLTGSNVAGNTFTVSGWAFQASLTGGTGGTNTMVASKAASTSFILSNTSLSSSDGMSLSLSGITQANLTSSLGTFTVDGWTGTGTLTGKTVKAAKACGALTLSNTGLTSSSDGMSLTLSGLTVANLTDSLGGGSFTVSGWTHTGTLSDTGNDTVTATKSANFTLTNTSLSSGDGMSLTLSGNITTANLTDTGGNHSFTVGGWTHSGTLTDSGSGTDTVIASKAANVTLLADSTLTTSDGMSLTLSTIGKANLTVTGGGHSVNLNGWSGSGTLAGTGGSNTLSVTANANLSLANTSLVIGTQTFTLSGLGTANLTDTGGGHSFTVSNWTGNGSLTDAAVNPDTVSAAESASYTLTNSTLTAGSMSLSLTNITTANLSDTGSGHTFTVSGWTYSGSLVYTGTGVDTVAAAKPAGNNDNMTLSDNSLTSSDGMNLTLSGITKSSLTVTGSGTEVVLDASAFSGTSTLSAASSVSAKLYGGAGTNSMSTTSSGNCVLIGGPGNDTLKDTGTGYNILIGGTGADTLIGNGNDILISGTTSYNSNTSANIAALDAILAEWSSNDSYLVRISKITSGTIADGYGFVSLSYSLGTVQHDSSVNVVKDAGGAPAGTQHNWFLVNTGDSVTKQSQETKTTS